MTHYFIICAAGEVLEIKTKTKFCGTKISRTTDKLAQPFFFLSLARLNYLSEKFVKNFAILFCSFTLCLFIVVVFLFTIHSFINPSIHPFIHSVSQSASQSFVYSLIRSFSRSFTCVKLLFCFPDKVSKKHSVF